MDCHIPCSVIKVLEVDLLNCITVQDIVTNKSMLRHIATKFDTILKLDKNHYIMMKTNYNTFKICLIIILFFIFLVFPFVHTKDRGNACKIEGMHAKERRINMGDIMREEDPRLLIRNQIKRN